MHLAAIDWDKMWVPSAALRDVMRHGTVMYLGLVVLFRAPRRDAGGLSMADVLLVVCAGVMLPRNMRRALITADALKSRLRQQGIARIEEVHRGCPEPDGPISMLATENRPGRSSPNKRR